MLLSKKVKVNCTKNNKAGFTFTLVDNETGQAMDFLDSRTLLNYLVDHFGKASSELERRVEAKYDEWKNEKEEADKWQTYRFYLNRDIGPFVINQFDGSSHVKSWEVNDSNAFGKNDIVLVEYVADQQILFQTDKGVAIKL